MEAALFVWLVLLPLVLLYLRWLDRQPSDSYRQQVLEHTWEKNRHRYYARQMADATEKEMRGWRG